jgi:hypothetical protein
MSNYLILCEIYHLVFKGVVIVGKALKIPNIF